MPLSVARPRPAPRRPRLAFVGLGWIGRARMQSLLASGVAEAVALVDPSAEAVASARTLAPEAETLPDLDAALALRPDGVVIATPSARHAAETIRALEAGAAVFCQKPLGRDAAEVAAAVAAARRADRLLGVDLSYRHTAAMRAIRPLVAGGGLGRVFAVDLVFHNAYGPDKPWFYDRRQSGGGCLADLGVHLVDLALWTLGYPEVREARGHLLAQGRPLADPAAVEDHALGTLVLEGGTLVRLACSWKLHAGRDAVIGCEFHGTEGGAAMRNVAGSFYDFEALAFRGTSTEVLAHPPDDWGGRALADWAARLGEGAGFDPEAAHLVRLHDTLDRLAGGG